MAETGTNSEKSPESNNVVLFRTVVTNCLKSIAESVSEEEFTNTVTILKSNPHVAGKLHRVMEKQLYDSMCADLDDILAEGTLSSGLTKVAKLAQEATNRPDEIAWRPPGNVEEHLRSLDARIMKEKSDKLEARVLEMETENERLMMEIADKRTKVRAVVDRANSASKLLPSVVPKLEKTIQQLDALVSSLETTVVD